MPDLIAEAKQLDATDTLARVRAQFQLPPGVYACGHSLGPMPHAATGYLQEVHQIWGERAVEGHFIGSPAWAEYTAPLEAISARLVGAQPNEVLIAHSLSINLHLMLASFYQPRADRNCILIERPAFPSDRYAVASHASAHGGTVIEVEPGQLVERIAVERPRLALVLAGAVNYYTGESLDLAACTRAAHAAGALIGFDLAHAVGNVPIALDTAGADFAVWCGYKYLCGGPGAPAGLFVHARHFAPGVSPRPRLAGWWGNRPDTRFEMRDAFEPASGAAGWAVSCPSILALAGLRAGLEVYDSAPAVAWHAKRAALSAAFERWAQALVPEVSRITPAARGAQWSLDLGAGAGRIHQRLRADGIVCDVRGPILRVSFHPLYNTFEDVATAVTALQRAVALP